MSCSNSTRHALFGSFARIDWEQDSCHQGSHCPFGNDESSTRNSGAGTISRRVGNGDWVPMDCADSGTPIGCGISGCFTSRCGIAKASEWDGEAASDASPTSRSNSSLDTPFVGNDSGASYMRGLDCATKALQNNVSNSANVLACSLNLRTNSDTSILHAQTFLIIHPWTTNRKYAYHCYREIQE